MQSLYKNVQKTLLLAACLTGLLLTSSPASSQRPVNQVATDVNEVDVTFVNNGIVGLDIETARGGGLWPRSSQNPGVYIFGSGVWFGAKIDAGGGAEPEPHIFMTYNPNSGRSWAAPGDVADGPEMLTDPALVEKYHMYDSRNYMANGQAVDGELPAWPMWNPGGAAVGPTFGNFGTYVANLEQRNSTEQNSSPVYISDQDLICRYKSTDTELYSGQQPVTAPLPLQFEQAAYAWADPARENFILIRYDITNSGDEVMQDCHFAHAGDFDIGDPLTQREDAADDRMQSFTDAADRPMVAMWSGGGTGPKDARYGYFGIAMLQTPAVDENGFLRDDVAPDDFGAQIGLTTVRNWVIQNDPTGTEERYDFISAPIIDANVPGGADRRLAFSCGPFNLRPGETARVVMGFFFANSVGAAPDGSEADVANLVEEVNKGVATWTSLVVSVDDAENAPAFDIRLSPNPVNNVLTISAEGLPGILTAQLDIVDASGRTLISQELHVDPLAGLRQELDVNTLSAGTYYCRLRMGEFTHSESFVLMR